jgi:Mg-chelatase subunit ChlD
MAGRALLEAKLAIREFVQSFAHQEIDRYRFALFSFGDPIAQLRVPLQRDPLYLLAQLAELRAMGTTPLTEVLSLLIQSVEESMEEEARMNLFQIHPRLNTQQRKEARTPIEGSSEKESEKREKIAILITDGHPDHPASAREAAKKAHRAGIRIITLGLGKEVDEVFLSESISSDPSDYRGVGEAIELSNSLSSLATLLSPWEGALTKIALKDEEE